VFIATINGYGRNTKVSINPHLFEINQRGDQLPFASGTLTVLERPTSPFRCNKVIDDFIKNGRENEDVETPKETPKRKRKDYISELKILLKPKFQKIEIIITPIN
jgi:hypothetical protein